MRYRATLANNIIFFVGSILVAGLLYAVFYDAGLQILEAGAEHSTQSEYAQQGNEWTRQAWEFLPFFILILGLLQLLAAAALEAQLP